MPRAASDIPEQFQKLIPLTPAVLFILLVLAGGEKHGYAIMQEVAVLSERKVRMGPGTLYTTIQRLLDQRLIDEVSTKSQADGRRRYYRLTRTGKAVLETEMGRLEALVRLARKRKLEFQNNE
jgi:DNA-binding PadR family transcriptional regulator